MSANFIAQALVNHLARAAAQESEKFTGSRTLVYSGAARRLFVVGTLIGALVFSMAVSSMPEERRAELACFFGVLLLLPFALAGAEVFLTQVTFDEEYIRASSPWSRRRRIPWVAVTECCMAEGEYYVTLRTQGYGVVKLNFFMRGVGELIDMTMNHITEQAQAVQREVAVHDGVTSAVPHLSVTIMDRDETVLRLIGGFLILGGIAAMLYSAFMPGTQPSAYTTFSGILTECQRIGTEDSPGLGLWVSDPAAGPLRPGFVRHDAHFAFSCSDGFPEKDFLQSARKGAPITLTALKKDIVKIKTTAAPLMSSVDVAAIQVGGREYYTLTQYLAAQKFQRFILMFMGVIVASVGVYTRHYHQRQKRIY